MASQHCKGLIIIYCLILAACVHRTSPESAGELIFPKTLPCCYQITEALEINVDDDNSQHNLIAVTVVTSDRLSINLMSAAGQPLFSIHHSPNGWAFQAAEGVPEDLPFFSILIAFYLSHYPHIDWLGAEVSAEFSEKFRSADLSESKITVTDVSSNSDWTLRDIVADGFGGNIRAHLISQQKFEMER